MLSKYQKTGNFGLAVAAGSFVSAALLGSDSPSGNIWESGGAPIFLMYGIVAGFILMFWSYTKAKGHSGWLGILLPVINVIGLVILLKLEDKHPVTEELKESNFERYGIFVLIAAGFSALAYVFFTIGKMS